MTEDSHDRIYRKDYAPSAFLVDAVDLSFELDPAETVVRAKMQLRRNPDLPDGQAPLRLHGEELELRAVRLDGSALDAARQGLGYIVLNCFLRKSAATKNCHRKNRELPNITLR